MSLEESKYKRVGLENRLIDFALKVYDLTKHLPNDQFGKHVSGQLVRSSSSPAFNYGEAQSAESRKDFIHKMRICLKELRETLIGLKFIERGKFKVPIELLNYLIKENNELISIFVISVETAMKNLIINKQK